jgi:hypothetical protein
MKLPATGRLAAALLALAAPAFGATVYVPVLQSNGDDGSTRSTELWLTTYAPATRAVTTVLVAADLDGRQPLNPPTTLSVPSGKTFLVTSLARSNQTNLLHVTAADSVAVQARLATTASSGLQTFAEVPVISAANQLAAGSKVRLIGLERDVPAGHFAHLGVVNLATSPAQCDVAFFHSDGSAVSALARITVKPISLRHFADVLASVGGTRTWAVRAEVTCDQPFYAYGVFAAQEGQSFFITPSAGSSAAPAPNPTPTPTPTPQPGDAVVFRRNGVFHTSTGSNPKGVVNVTVPRALDLERLVVDFDFVPGPWSKVHVPGAHGLLWLHRGKFRSNTIGNLNAFGPNKFTFKFNQNLDLPAGDVTSAEGGVSLTQGQTYHVRYTYDAEARLITAVLSRNGTVLRTLTAAGTAAGRVLRVAASGIRAEFGHHHGQHEPEVGSPPGWSFSNLVVEMHPK